VVENIENSALNWTEASEKQATEGTRSAARACAALTGIAPPEDSIFLKIEESSFDTLARSMCCGPGFPIAYSESGKPGIAF